MMTERWAHGQLINRREVLGFEPTNTTDQTTSWFGKAWMEVGARVVIDEPDRLVLYVPTGSPFVFPEHDWPIAGGRHPWGALTSWTGHGCLMLHRPGDHYAIWHFWDGPGREFNRWYLNVQTNFRRHDTTFDTQDLELDFVVAPDLTWEIKDWDAVIDRVAEGRYSTELGEWIHNYGHELIERLETEGPWWDLSWATWTPPAAWDS